MIALAAFHEFLRSHYEKQPSAYRPFTVTLVGITDDFIGEQIRAIGASTLGERLQAVPTVSHARALERSSTSMQRRDLLFVQRSPARVCDRGHGHGSRRVRNDAGGRRSSSARA